LSGVATVGSDADLGAWGAGAGSNGAHAATHAKAVKNRHRQIDIGLFQFVWAGTRHVSSNSLKKPFPRLAGSGQ
jgi:hypothetical protein